MSHCFHRRLPLAAALLLAVLTACSATEPSIQPPGAPAPAAARHVLVSGLPQEGVLDAALAASLGIEVVEQTFRSERHRYRAVPLDRVLQHFGFAIGPGGRDREPSERHRGLRSIVLAHGSDGFVAVFSCAELLAEMGPTRAYVAFAHEHGELAPDEGPVRLLVPTDQKGSRAVRQLVRLEVRDARELPTDAGATPAVPPLGP